MIKISPNQIRVNTNTKLYHIEDEYKKQCEQIKEMKREIELLQKEIKLLKSNQENLDYNYDELVKLIEKK